MTIFYLFFIYLIIGLLDTWNQCNEDCFLILKNSMYRKKRNISILINFLKKILINLLVFPIFHKLQNYCNRWAKARVEFSKASFYRM